MNPLSPTFSNEMPSDQNALDIFLGGWTSGMPVDSGLRAGHITGHFTDGRVPWAAGVLGGFAGKSVLELGPFEGYNSYQLENAGASVFAVESSNINFLKCLIVKNIFSMASKFQYGDFIPYLESTSSRFDVCWASGVLYHMTDPLRLVRALSRVSDTLFIWTQYYDRDVIEGDPDQRKFFMPDGDREEVVGDSTVVLHYRSYLHQKTATFSGGEDVYSFWLSKPDVLHVLRSCGYESITMGVDNPKHGAGPACFFIAKRDPANGQRGQSAG